MAVRDRILSRFILTQGVHNEGNVRRVYYLSLEYLMGRLLEANLHNTGLYDIVVAAVVSSAWISRRCATPRKTWDWEMGSRPSRRVLPRFACHARLSGHRVRHSLRVRTVQAGVRQRPAGRTSGQLDHLRRSMEIVRPEYTQRVQLYGHVEQVQDENGKSRPGWVNTQTVLGVPYDIPIAGYGTKTVNFLRLWPRRRPRSSTSHL